MLSSNERGKLLVTWTHSWLFSDEIPIKLGAYTEVSTDSNPQGPQQSQMVIGKTIKDTKPSNEEVFIILDINWQHL